MSANEDGADAKRKVGVNFDSENYEWLKASGNITGKINEIIAAHRTGKVVATGQVLQGEDGKGCIQPLEYNKPELCPFRVAYPRLQQAANGLVLQNEFCVKCPYYKRDYEHFKVNIRLMARAAERNVKPNLPLAESKPQKQTQTLTRNPFKCRNGCGTMITWVQVPDGKYLPYDVESGTQHYCPNHSRPAPAAPQQPKEPENSGQRVKCSDCGESIATFMKDAEALDRLLDLFMMHIKSDHGRQILTEAETRQFRMLREVPQ